jgi:hypothetical protein
MSFIGVKIGSPLSPNKGKQIDHSPSPRIRPGEGKVLLEYVHADEVKGIEWEKKSTLINWEQVPVPLGTQSYEVGPFPSNIKVRFRFRWKDAEDNWSSWTILTGKTR